MFNLTKIFNLISTEQTLDISQVRITEYVELKPGLIVKSLSPKSQKDVPLYVVGANGLGLIKVSTFSKCANPKPGSFLRAEWYEYNGELEVIGASSPQDKIRKAFVLYISENRRLKVNLNKFSVSSFFEQYSLRDKKDIRNLFSSFNNLDKDFERDGYKKIDFFESESAEFSFWWI